MVRVFSPGRVELLGNHTDYNAGVVLSSALNLGTTVTGSIGDGSNFAVLRSSGFPECCVDISAPLSPTGTWSDYPLGVVSEFLKAGFPIGGFEAEFSSNLPVGAGLSSSAAIEVATAVFLTRIFGISIEPLEMAHLCKRAENTFAGVNCGILDQVSCIFGKRGHVIYLDCRDESVTTVPVPDGLGLLIVHSGVKHALTGGEYNERREQCFEAARILGVRALRDVTTADLSHPELPEIVRRRAAHITGENERVMQGLVALNKGQLAEFGNLLTASHDSSRHNFENSTPQLDTLVELAIHTPGVFGARLTGGGFGGAIVALVDQNQIASAKSAILAAYESATGIKTNAYICEFGDGAMTT